MKFNALTLFCLLMIANNLKAVTAHTLLDRVNEIANIDPRTVNDPAALEHYVNTLTHASVALANHRPVLADASARLANIYSRQYLRAITRQNQANERL